MREIYLDNAATRKQSKESIDKMLETLDKFYANPSSAHNLGFLAEKELSRSRQTIASSLNAKENEIVFTSGGSESNNLAIQGYLNMNPRRGRKLLIGSSEHSSVIKLSHHLQDKGYIVNYIPMKNMAYDLEYLYSNIDKETALVSIGHVNSETGLINPLEEINRKIKQINRDTVIHNDCVQSYGKFKIDVKKMNANLLSISGHKIGGPRGTGALYVKDGIRLEALLFGGSQEKDLRAGTENLPAIAGLAKASEDIHMNMDSNFKHVSRLRDLLFDAFYEDEEIFMVSSKENSPYIINISFKNILGEVLLHALAKRGVYVSIGSACMSKQKNLSHVLKAMNLPDSIIKGAIRISLSENNTVEEIKEAIEVINEERKKIIRV